MSNSLVSVITPVYTIAATLDSVLAQNLVVDGSSTESTAQIVQRLMV